DDAGFGLLGALLAIVSCGLHCRLAARPGCGRLLGPMGGTTPWRGEGWSVRRFFVRCGGETGIHASSDAAPQSDAVWTFARARSAIWAAGGVGRRIRDLPSGPCRARP